MEFESVNMEFESVKEWAKAHGVSERTARNYCAKGKIPGAYLVGKTWNIPADADVPERKKREKVSLLLQLLRDQKDARMRGGDLSSCAGRPDLALVL